MASRNLSPCIGRFVRARTALPVALMLIIAASACWAGVKRMCQDTLNRRLVYAVADSDVEFARQLLQRGADPNTRDFRGDLPLTLGDWLWHAMGRHQTAGYYNTVLQLAIANLNPALPMVKLLLNAGANPSVSNEYQDTPLARSIRESRYSLVKALLAAGADVNFRDRQGATSLARAVDTRDPALVSLVLAKHPDVNAPDVYCMSPLIHACYGGESRMIKLLIEEGADVNAKDYYGRSVLKVFAAHTRRTADYERAVELLMRAGAVT